MNRRRRLPWWFDGRAVERESPRQRERGRAAREQWRQEAAWLEMVAVNAIATQYIANNLGWIARGLGP